MSLEPLGTERIPRARRISATQVNKTSIVRTSVEDKVFRIGRRECLNFVAIAKEPFNDRKLVNPQIDMKSSIGRRRLRSESVGLDLEEDELQRRAFKSEKSVVHEESLECVIRW